MLFNISKVKLNFVSSSRKYFSLGSNYTTKSAFITTMKFYIRLNSGGAEPSDAVNRTADAILSGSPVALPTDTLYGLACLASDSLAIQKIYDIKERSDLKPLTVCVADIDDIYRICNVTCPRSLLEQLLPGPVTLIFDRRPPPSQPLAAALGLSSELNASSDSKRIGVRIPDCDFIRAVSRKCAQLLGEKITLIDGTFPKSSAALALTSANPSGAPSCLEAHEFASLWPRLGLVCDGGRIGGDSGIDEKTLRAGSTVIDLSIPNTFGIVRAGCVHQRVLDLLRKSYSYEERR